MWSGGESNGNSDSDSESNSRADEYAYTTADAFPCRQSESITVLSVRRKAGDAAPMSLSKRHARRIWKMPLTCDRLLSAF